jgi:hypothetical protein
MTGTHEEFLKSIRSVVQEAEDRTKKMDRSWHNISMSVEEIGRKFETGWTASITKSFGKQGQIMQAMDKLSQFLKDPAAEKGKLASMKKEGDNIVANVLTLMTKQRNLALIGGELSAQEKSILRDSIARGLTLEKEIKLSGALAKLDLERMVWLPAILGSIKGAAEWTDKMQVALINANASLKDRYVLMTDINQVQRSTGALTDEMAEATAAATKHALHMGPTFRDNMDIIVKMKEGLGVSSDNSATLLATMNKMGSSAREVANAIARVKADTGLAADEATRLAVEITRAMAVIAPGGNVVGAVETFGKLEGAATQLGVAAGSVTRSMLALTKPEGFGGISMLGLQPDFIKDQATAAEAFKRRTEFMDRILKPLGTSAPARMMVLAQFAEKFQTTTDELARSSQILELYNKKANTATTLQQEWQKQTSLFAKSWDKLKNQFSSLIHGALLPLVEILQKIVDRTTQLTTKLASWGGATTAVQLALGGIGLATLYKSASLFKNIGGVLKEFAVLGPVGARMGSTVFQIGRFMTGTGGFFTRLLGFMNPLNPISWPVYAGLLGTWIGSNKKVSAGMMKLYDKMFGTKVGAIRAKEAGDITHLEWQHMVTNMRQGRMREDVVKRWAMGHIKNISDFKDMVRTGRDPSKAIAGMQEQYVAEGKAVQAMKYRYASTWDADPGGMIKLAQQQVQLLRDLVNSNEMWSEFEKTAEEERKKMTKEHLETIKLNTTTAAINTTRNRVDRMTIPGGRR